MCTLTCWELVGGIIGKTNMFVGEFSLLFGRLWYLDEGDFKFLDHFAGVSHKMWYGLQV